MVTTNAGPRVVITGVGIVSPVGIGTEAFSAALANGTSGVRTVEAFSARALPVQFAGEVRGFDPKQHIKTRKSLKLMSRDIELGVAAANMAMEDAGIETGQVAAERLGVGFGADMLRTTPEDLSAAVRACFDDQGRFEFDRWATDGMPEVFPLWMLRYLPNMPACHIAIIHEARGPNNTITSAEVSALQAVAEATRVIQRGVADVMIAGAASSRVQPLQMTRSCVVGELSRRNDDPAGACRPFDADRDGMVIGEGAAAFVLERYDDAVAAGRRIYGEVLGLGQTFNLASPQEGFARAVAHALAEAGLTPEQIGHVNAHGESTRRGDCLEAEGLSRALGRAAAHVPVTAPKSFFGNSGAGSGAMELAASLMALEADAVPATLNFQRADPQCTLNVVHGEPLKGRPTTALCVNRTSYGQSAAVVVGRV
jgi:3-oxoacyl-[acyl-carrier-protein] synthase II